MAYRAVASALLMPDKTYGARFRELMEHLGGGDEARGRKELKGWLTQPDISKVLTLGQPPRLATIRKHARALRVQPSDLLDGVVTLLDQIRRGDFDAPTHVDEKRVSGFRRKRRTLSA